MKLSTLQSSFNTAIGCASLSVDKKTKFPILAHLLLDANNGNLQITGTNLETSITVSLNAKIEDAGATCSPLYVLGDYVKTLAPERVTLELTEKTQVLKLGCARTSTYIKGIDALEFPIITTSPDNFTDCAISLKDVLTVKTTADKYLRDQFSNYVRLVASSGKLVITAMNQNSQVVREFPYTGDFSGAVSYTSLVALDKLIGKLGSKKYPASISLATTDKGIFFKVSQTGTSVPLVALFYTAFQEVNFPELKTPQPVSAFCVNADDLRESLKVLSAVNPFVQFSVNGSLRLVARTVTPIMQENKVIDDYSDEGYHYEQNQIGEETEHEITAQISENYDHRGVNCEFFADAKTVLAALGKYTGPVWIGYTAPKVPALVALGESESMFAIA